MHGYVHWQIALSKRFRSLKLWFVIRNYGVKGLQKHIRHGVNLAEKFEEFVQSDKRFEIAAKRHLGLVVFRLASDNALTEALLKRLNSRGKVHCVPAALKSKYVIRFTVTSQRTTLIDIENDWKEIREVATEILKNYDFGNGSFKIKKVPLKDTKKEQFGASLLLSNVPMSPKIVNGSFAAVYDCDSLSKTFNDFNLTSHTSPAKTPKQQLQDQKPSGTAFTSTANFKDFKICPKCHHFTTKPLNKSNN